VALDDVGVIAPQSPNPALTTPELMVAEGRSCSSSGVLMFDILEAKAATEIFPTLRASDRRKAGAQHLVPGPAYLGCRTKTHASVDLRVFLTETDPVRGLL